MLTDCCRRRPVEDEPLGADWLTVATPVEMPPWARVCCTWLDSCWDCCVVKAPVALDAWTV